MTNDKVLQKPINVSIYAIRYILSQSPANIFNFATGDSFSLSLNPLKRPSQAHTVRKTRLLFLTTCQQLPKRRSLTNPTAS